MADQTIDLTDESSDVEVCGVDDDIIVVKETGKRRQGQALTVIVHENGRGEPVKCCSRQTPPKKRLSVVTAPPAKPVTPKKSLKCPVCLESVSLSLLFLIHESHVLFPGDETDGGAGEAAGFHEMWSHFLRVLSEG